MNALFGAAFGPAATLDVTLSNVERRLQLPEGEGQAAGVGFPVYIYSAGESVEGTAKIAVPPGKKLEHIGIRAELKGVVGAERARSPRTSTSTSRGTHILID